MIYYVSATLQHSTDLSVGGTIGKKQKILFGGNILKVGNLYPHDSKDISLLNLAVVITYSIIEIYVHERCRASEKIDTHSLISFLYKNIERFERNNLMRYLM